MTPARPLRGFPSCRRRLALAAAALLALAATTTCGGPRPRPEGTEPLVFAAASTVDALEEGLAAFQAETGIRARASYGPTSMLAQQVVEGAPADLFLAASLEWAEFVAERHPVVERRPLVGNALVVIRPAGAEGSPPASEDAGEEPTAASLPEGADTLGTAATLQPALGTGRIAVADPDAVPAGIYARQALDRVGLWERLRPRLVPTLDVRAALALVERGEAEAGIVYRSDAAAATAVRVAGVIDPRLHEPIVYPLLLLREGKASRRLYEFLTTPAGMSPFARRGFVPAGPRVR